MDNRFSVAIIWNYLPKSIRDNVYFMEYLEGIKDKNELALIYHAVKNLDERGDVVTLEKIYSAAGVNWQYRTDVIYQYLSKPIKSDPQLMKLLENDTDEKRREDIYNFFVQERKNESNFRV